MKKMIGVVVGILLGVLASFAATNDLTVGDGYGYPGFAAGKVYVLEGTIDFATDDGTTGDVYQVISIPANTWVLGCIAEIVTAETTNHGGAVIDIGDSSDADGWMADVVTTNVALDTTSRTITVGTNFAVTVADAYGLGKWYSSAGKITATSSGNVDTGKMKIRAVVIDGN